MRYGILGGYMFRRKGFEISWVGSLNTIYPWITVFPGTEYIGELVYVLD